MDWWVTPSGTTVGLEIGSQRKVPNQDAVGVNLNVASTGGMQREVQVRFNTPTLINVARKDRGDEPLSDDDRTELARLATLRSVEENPYFFEGSETSVIAIGPGDDTELLDAPPISDSALRQYIARRLYLEWREGGFDQVVEFGELDGALTGMEARAFLRNLQVLEEDGYVRLERGMGHEFRSFTARGTGKLIRAVEDYGAAPEDVEKKEDYLQLIRKIPDLEADVAAIALQRERYSSARTAEEVESVFRSLVPIVEDVVSRLLAARGSEKQHTSLGPMIEDLKNRGIGGVSLTSQLAAVKTNARDISLHGGDLPTSVIRIAVETCFGLLPQLGRLFPDDRDVR